MGRLRIDRLAGPPRPLLDDRGRVVAARCYSATTVLTRLLGLLGTPDLADDEALWLAPCSAVHAIGLRARVSCAFVDAEGVVLRVLEDYLGLRGAQAGAEEDQIGALDARLATLAEARTRRAADALKAGLDPGLIRAAVRNWRVRSPPYGRTGPG